MRITYKVVILHVGVLLVFALSILGYGYALERSSVAEWEEAEVEDNVLRVYYAWEVQVEALSTIVGDWAPWDDLYSFVSHPEDPIFIEKNLTDSAMANLRVDGVIIVDQLGNQVFNKRIDLDTKKEVAEEAALVQMLQNMIVANGQTLGDEQNLRGYISYDKNPVMFSLQAILTSEKNAPRIGYLLFYRHVDEKFVQQLNVHTRVRVHGMVGEGSQEKLIQDIAVRETRTDGNIETAILLKDIYGEHSFAIVAVTPRNIHQAANEQMKKLLAMMIAGICGSAGMAMLLLNRMIHQRILLVDQFMAGFVSSSGEALRLRLSGNDELSRMAATMNMMLDRIDETVRKNNKLYKVMHRELNDRLMAEEKLRYQYAHDSLTDLYNRTYFDQTIANILDRQVQAVGVICCDVDGLKLINDTLGHGQGDEVLRNVAQILRQVLPETAVACRIGGDEFVVLLEGAVEAQVEAIAEELRVQIEKSDLEMGNLGYALSVAIGYSFITGEMTAKGIRDAVKQADDNMYRQKLSRESSNRHAIILGMMEMLKVRDFITEGHSQRLQERVTVLGRRIGLAETKISDLVLLAQFHDIGKVGISDQILFKSGKLNDEEWQEMKRHSEIGYRIAQSLPELAPISDLILKHHERWDGTGYPLNLSGDSIPIEDRILAIADSYDAMTNDRPYRAAMTVESAIVELRRHAGTQFDPCLVKMFIEIIEEEEENVVRN